MKKSGKTETRHLASSANEKLTVCGRPIGKVLLWAKKSPPKADDATVCGRCRMLQARTEKAVAREKAMGDWKTKGTPVKKEPGKRQPALLVLGDRMPDELRVTFKGKEYLAAVDKDGGIRVEGHEQSFNSPSRAGKAVASREVDGWTFWSYLKADGTREKLDALRKAVA